MSRLAASILGVLVLISSVASVAARSDIRAERAARSAADPAGRWIVVLNPGTDVDATAGRQTRRFGFATDGTYRTLVRGYSARLSATQVRSLQGDSAVEAVVPDERIEMEAQTMPTGISRIGAIGSATAKIDGADDRVDADVAVVDTGVAKIAELNVAGGYNCSTSNHGAWRDVQGHGTHVAGTIGAIDNGSGVVGVAPGVRIWAVKILDDGGMGLLSWYICGLDWIAAQKDPNDPTRPLIEAVNMSVAKDGSDDRNCGATNNDLLHAAICRLVAKKVTVAAAAANDSQNAATRVPAAYDEVITVSALADTDGLPGGLGGNRCLSWGGYDVDDTFANFSNYGRDVDVIAPGKCIWSTVPGGYKYMSGTSMATPHVTGAIALLKATRPYLSPAEVKEALLYLGTMDWRTNTDPDPWHEKLLDVSRIGPRGDFAITAGEPAVVTQAGGTASIPITVLRTETLFERINLRVDRLPGATTATFSPASLYGFDAMDSQLVVNVPAGTPAGTYEIRISATEHNRVHATTATIVVGGSSFTSGAPGRVFRRS